jgi:uncharacterized membrane protein YuzA (DUF378 family)
MKVLGYVAIGIATICLIISAILAIDRFIYPHHPPALVTTIIFVIIGTVLVYVGMHLVAPKSKQENGSDSDSDSRFKNGFNIFILFLLESAVTVEALLYLW